MQENKSPQLIGTFKARPILSVDFESSDLPENKGRPIEFAAVMLDPYTLLPIEYSANICGPSAEFHVFLKLQDDEPMSQEAWAVHGISKERLENIGVSRYEGLGLFWNWLAAHGFKTPVNTPHWGDWKNGTAGQIQVLGQNVHFDLHFLKFWLGGDSHLIFHYKYLDNMPLADFVNRAHEWALGFDTMPFRHPDTNLPSVSQIAQAHAFGLPIEGAHGALFDAKTCAEIYRLHIVTFSGDLRRSREHYTAEDRARITGVTGQPGGHV